MGAISYQNMRVMSSGNSPTYPKRSPLTGAAIRKAQPCGRAPFWHRYWLVICHLPFVIGHLQAIPSPSLSAQQRLAEMQEDLS
jgi:hypothetical protein